MEDWRSKIILVDQDRRFALDKGRKTTGRIVIETNGKNGHIQVEVDNLYYFYDERYNYKLIFFGKKQGETLYHIFGDVNISKRGRGNRKFDFDKDSFEKGDIKDFSVASIVGVSKVDPKEPLYPILRGNISWKKKKAAPKKTYNDYYNTYLLMNCQSLEQKSEIYDDIKPFAKDVTGAKWKRIGNLNRFPMISPGSSHGISKYRHFIFGTGQEHYFIGIPGRFLEKEQPENGNSGFALWQPIIGAEQFEVEKEGSSLENRQVAYGYWIAKIGRKDGTIEDL
ncbi:MAG: hypothetical protein RSD88_02185 [Anaerovoracaceae bacterium]